MINFILLSIIISVNSYGWLPLIDLNTFNTKKIQEIKILDKKLVIWEKDNNIIVQDNTCIHRGAPLSEGYIDKQTNNIRCSYHGWEFSENGNVISIPQFNNICNKCNNFTLPKEFKNTAKYYQKTYATKKSNNILWINLNDSYVNFPQHISDYNNSVSQDMTVIEVPYTINILLENLFDPAHVPFAHHNLQSNRNLASSVNCTLINMNSTSLEILFEDNTLRNNQYRNATMTLLDNYHYILKSIYPEVFIKRLHVYCVPIFPHKTRIFVQNEYDNGFFSTFYSNLPRWLKHILTQRFFDSDTMLLYKQEQELRNKKALSNSTTTYITPTSSDKAILLFHNWKKKYPSRWSNIINNDDTPFHDLSRKQIFDRYNTHTKNCKSCLDSLNNIKKIQKIIPFILTYLFIERHMIQSILLILIFYILEEFKTFFVSKNYVHNNL